MFTFQAIFEKKIVKSENSEKHCNLNITLLWAALRLLLRLRPTVTCLKDPQFHQSLANILALYLLKIQEVFSRGNKMRTMAKNELIKIKIAGKLQIFSLMNNEHLKLSRQQISKGVNLQHNLPLVL